jgi:hypothetical protein
MKKLLGFVPIGIAMSLPKQNQKLKKLTLS